MAASSALQELQICSSFLRQGLSSWKVTHSVYSGACAALGVRFYRGSNRDTRRRERNLRAKLKKREPEDPKVFDRKEFFTQNYERELFSFKSRLGLKFNDKNLLVTAFTHESYKDDYVNDNDDEDSDTIQTRENNAKLSLLGLTATSLFIVDHLCTTYPSLPRLGVRCFHDFLVGRRTIVKLCNQISLPDLIRLEHDLDDLQKEKHLDYRKEDVICDTFFALVGAIYIDQGSNEAKRFVEDFVIAQLHGEELYKLFHFDYPGKVLENIFTIQGKEKPVARVIQRTGVNSGVPVYVVGVFSGDKMLAEASSYTEIRAKNEALKAALMKHCQEGMLLPFVNERKKGEKISL